MLTKSLHTVTSAVAVAEHLIKSACGSDGPWTPSTLAREALRILGHKVTDSADSDITYARILKGCAKLLEGAK